MCSAGLQFFIIAGQVGYEKGFVGWLESTLFIYTITAGTLISKNRVLLSVVF